MIKINKLKIITLLSSFYIHKVASQQSWPLTSINKPFTFFNDNSAILNLIFEELVRDKNTAITSKMSPAWVRRKQVDK